MNKKRYINFTPLINSFLLKKKIFLNNIFDYILTKTPTLIFKNSKFFIFLKKNFSLPKLFFKILLKYRFKKKNSKNYSKKYINSFKAIYFFLFSSNKGYIKYFFIKNFKLEKIFTFILSTFKKTLGEGFIYLRGLFLFFFFDACFTDDEPLWEPIEWSLVQTWLLFIFTFAWIAENLITSRFGSFTGRDKRVWFAWHKTFWLIEAWYALCYGAAAMFVIVPFYYEITYTISFVHSWWNWYNRVFFFKFISIYTLIILIAHYLQINIRWLSWKKIFFLSLLINVFITYLLYTQFIITFFGYFTDPLWYQKTRSIDYIQLSHEPLKWGWGPSKRDHFTYHKTSTVFWFKNDGPFAEAFLMINMFFFISIFFLLIYWLTFLRRIYAIKEVSHTFTTFCISSLKQFFFLFFLFFIMIFISFIVCYWRFPIEFIWMIETTSWSKHFFDILINYWKIFF
uniref:Uncharacterized protein n=1 Tax=Stylonychia lemnae TaxID=5949 RepID=A0A3S6K270_STYLE|nr:hypothetical protein [Stylonychia lemnae]